MDGQQLDAHRATMAVYDVIESGKVVFNHEDCGSVGEIWNYR